MALISEAEAFTYLADTPQAGVVLCHGFTGSPASMRPWGQYLHAAGLTVYGPRLPGHGTHPRDLARVTWEDWYGELERAFDAALNQANGKPVFAMGLSMGGALVTRLAEQRASEIAGLVLVNPAYSSLRRGFRLVPLVSRFGISVAGIKGDIKKPHVPELGYERIPLSAVHSMQRLWQVTRSDFRKVIAPVLVFRSNEDHVVEAINTQLVLQGISSTEKKEIILHDSYHVATLDNDAPKIFETSLDFIRKQLKAAS